MHLHCYIITLAMDAEDAKGNVRHWIDDYAGREFFDYGGIAEPEKVVLVNEVREELETSKEDTERLLPIIENDFIKYKANGDRGWEGYCHKRYGQILSEDLMIDMPFFNIYNWDWSIPSDVPNKTEGSHWYAVMADLHF